MTLAEALGDLPHFLHEDEDEDRIADVARMIAEDPCTERIQEAVRAAIPLWSSPLWSSQLDNWLDFWESSTDYEESDRAMIAWKWISTVWYLPFVFQETGAPLEAALEAIVSVRERALHPCWLPGSVKERWPIAPLFGWEAWSNAMCEKGRGYVRPELRHSMIVVMVDDLVRGAIYGDRVDLREETSLDLPARYAGPTRMISSEFLARLGMVAPDDGLPPRGTYAGGSRPQTSPTQAGPPPPSTTISRLPEALHGGSGNEELLAAAAEIAGMDAERVRTTVLGALRGGWRDFVQGELDAWPDDHPETWEPMFDGYEESERAMLAWDWLATTWYLPFLLQETPEAIEAAIEAIVSVRAELARPCWCGAVATSPAFPRLRYRQEDNPWTYRFEFAEEVHVAVQLAQLDALVAGALHGDRSDLREATTLALPETYAGPTRHVSPAFLARLGAAWPRGAEDTILDMVPPYIGGPKFSSAAESTAYFRSPS